MTDAMWSRLLPNKDAALPARDRSAVTEQESAIDPKFAEPETRSLGAEEPCFAEAEIRPPHLDESFCFGQTEIVEGESSSEAQASTALVAALDRCEGFDGTGFFVNRRNRRVDMTATAYELYQAILAGGEAAVDLAMARIPPGTRDRAPSREKLELLAVLLTAKPTTVEERKSCSAYSSLLIVAQAVGITVEGYRSWAIGIDLTDAEVQARNIRTALKTAAPDGFEGDPVPREPAYEFLVAVLVNGKVKESVRFAIDDVAANEVRTSITQAKATADLTKLANDIAEVSICKNQQPSTF